MTLVMNKNKSKIVEEGLKSNFNPGNSQMKRQIENSNSQMKRHSYKLTDDGQYGNLTIDLNQLTGFNKLAVTKDSKIIVNQNVDDDFIELITKRYNSEKTCSKESEVLFRDLT